MHRGGGVSREEGRCIKGVCVGCARVVRLGSRPFRNRRPLHSKMRARLRHHFLCAQRLQTLQSPVTGYQGSERKRAGKKRDSKCTFKLIRCVFLYLDC
jgi:hypothetical protein